MTIYSDYQRDKVGVFFGLRPVQLIVLGLATLPFFTALSNGAWVTTVACLVLWLVVLFLVRVDLGGRPVVGWLSAATSYAVGGLLGWTTFRSGASEGHHPDPDTPDLPGLLQTVRIHDGPPQGTTQTRVAVIQHHATRVWAVTAAVVHPGIAMEDGDERARYGSALAGLLDLATRTEKIEEIQFMVRTVPDDGAERELWMQRHARDGAPAAAKQINNELAWMLSRAAVRTETFVTIVVPEVKIARSAKESGGGFEGRFRELALLMGEVESHLRGPMGMRSVSWLTSPELAFVSRTGFAPGDRAGVIEAMAERETNPGVNAGVPWAMAGPSGADPAVRHYSHDAWNSVSSTIDLPERGVAMGALAPILTPGEIGERRSFVVVYPVASRAQAERQSGNAEWVADLSDGLNQQLGRKTRAKERDQSAKARGIDAKLAKGHALVRPYAVCTVTVPKSMRITEYARRLDSSVRRAGFAPLRLDLAQDAGFAASTLPLGLGLTRRSAL